MSRIKKAARLFAFICLIVLAGIGIGMSGGVPIPSIKNRKETEKENVELLEEHLKRIIKFIGIGLLLLILGIGVYIYNSGPILPEDAGNIISEVISKPLPEMINGETGFANSKGIKIWYESIAPKQESKGVVVLIMGISNLRIIHILCLTWLSMQSLFLILFR